MSNIYVTRAFLPPKEEYEYYISKIWETSHLTNNGPLLKEFELSIKRYLDIDNFQFVTNGTIALQIAIRSLELDQGEIITTPFSYVATTSAILWEGFTPIYADIDPETLCIDPEKIEKSITPNTRAILAVHVFGNKCDIEKIEKIAKTNNIKVIYDAAHSFGVKHEASSIFNFGDISVTSFHATKLFHTIEGGGIFTNSVKLNEKVDLIKRFGHYGDDYKMLGINAKSSEFQAAMGLCNLKYIDDIIADRKRAYETYENLLDSSLIRQLIVDKANYNYAYFPIVFSTDAQVEKSINALKKLNIYPRRYFYPSLNKLSYIKTEQSCLISESIASRILCLPMYYGITGNDISRIAETLNRLVR